VSSKSVLVIAGGGPTGLMLVGELALAGVDVAIVERRASQDLPGSRAGGLHARTIEVFDQRGIADRFLSQGQLAQVAGLPDPLDISDFPPGTITGSDCGRTTSSAYWPAGSVSWWCRFIADVK
jgi:3-(3-hydroxy-phenyl)propionate hydroxylase